MLRLMLMLSNNTEAASGKNKTDLLKEKEEKKKRSVCRHGFKETKTTKSARTHSCLAQVR